MRGPLSAHGVSLNIVAAHEHVPEIERFIRTVKERTRETYNSLPFTPPPRIVIEMVRRSIYWLNVFPPKDGVSTSLSPSAIITGHVPAYSKHCRVPFGTYCQIHNDSDKSMKARTTGGIALRPTGNTQGSHYFYAINTARRVTARNWTALPMPADVIQFLNRQAHRLRVRKGLYFQLRDKSEVPENETSDVITAGVVGEAAIDSDDSDDI